MLHNFSNIYCTMLLKSSLERSCHCGHFEPKSKTALYLKIPQNSSFSHFIFGFEPTIIELNLYKVGLNLNIMPKCIYVRIFGPIGEAPDGVFGSREIGL